MAIRLSDFDAIGFDVDHALIQYKLENLYPMEYNSLAKYLVETKDYPTELLEPFEKYADFCTRGLVLESENGNFVKISKDGKILRASHGTKILTEEQLNEEYGEDRQWKHFKEFCDEFKNKGRFLYGGKYRMFDNFFDIPAMLLCARLVDTMDSQGEGKEYKLMWEDVILSLTENFDSKAFKANKGYFYPAMKADVHKYVRTFSDKSKEWLTKLRKEGRKLFLITNSQADFSMFVLKAAFGNDSWLSYFDIAVSRAGKPVNGVTKEEEVKELEEGKYYADGNCADLERFFGKLTGKTDVKVLFCGDSFISDVYPPKRWANWDTVSLLEELGVEMKNSAENKNGDEKKNNNSDGEPDYKKAKLNELHTVDERADLKKLRSILESSTWGPVFGEDGQLMNTLFSSLLEEYVSLVIPDLGYLTGVDMDYPFVKNCNGTTRFYPDIPGIAPSSKTN